MEPKKIFRRLYKLLSRVVLEAPHRTGHSLPSLIHSTEHSSPPSPLLMEIACHAISLASRIEISGIRPDLPDSKLYNRFPGEHYRLLKALVELLKPETIVEIGTYTGMGSVALMQGGRGALHTFDIAPWNSFKSHLSNEAFLEGAIVQHLADLSNQSSFLEHQHIFESASLIFLDGPKDGVFERVMLTKLSQLAPKAGRLLVIDDIRFVNMIDNWNAIASPKLDLTSFGHWSGTGLVDLSESLNLL